MPSSANCASSCENETALDCDCPTSLPCPATEENVMQFKQYLLDYYRSSTFNTCEHQPLPMMEGPPMHLMIDPKTNQQPITHLYQFQSIGRMLLKRDWIETSDWEFWSPFLSVSQLLGAIGWSSVQRKMGNLEGPLTFNHSIVMPLGKLITLSLPFIKLDRFLIARRKQYSMLGMVTTVSHSTLMITTLLHLLPHGADTDIVLQPRVILLQGMAIQGIMMKLWPHFHGRRSV